MPARFEILVNDHRACLAGLESEGSLVTTFGYSLNTKSETAMCNLHVMCVKLDGGWFVWPVPPTSVDDEVRIRILPGGKFDEPIPWNQYVVSGAAIHCPFERRRLAVEVNNKRVLVAGYHQAGILNGATAYVDSPANNLELQLHVGGSLPTGEILAWQSPEPSWGDEITFRTLPHTDEFDAPTAIYGGEEK